MHLEKFHLVLRKTCHSNAQINHSVSKHLLLSVQNQRHAHSHVGIPSMKYSLIAKCWSRHFWLSFFTRPFLVTVYILVKKTRTLCKLISLSLSRILVPLSLLNLITEDVCGVNARDRTSLLLGICENTNLQSLSAI